MDENITGTPEERLEMPWRFDSGGKRYSGPRGIEEKDEFEARTRKDIAFEAENQTRWDKWNNSLPQGKELSEQEIADMIAADEGTVESAGVQPAVEPEPEKKEFRAGTTNIRKEEVKLWLKKNLE